MNRAILISGSLLSAAAAFIAGRTLGGPAAPVALAENAKMPRTARLADPNLIAQRAREQLEKLPPTLWVTVGPNQAAATETPLPTADLPPMPVVAASASIAPQTPKPAEEPDADAIAALLARSIAAVKRTNGAVSLLLVDPASGIRRTLIKGDIYRNGWRVARIDSRAILLVRHSQKIVVPVGFAPRSAAATPYAATITATPAAPDGRAAATSEASPGSPFRPRRRIPRPGSSDKQEI